MNNNYWKKFTLSYNTQYQNALQQQHHASQYIALAGRHLIPQQPDDSNTNMQYVTENEMLVGHTLPNGMRIGLQLSSLNLYILDNQENQIEKISLTGKTKKEGFEELRVTLSASGVDTARFNDKLHYSIPEHPLADDAVFSIEHSKYSNENVLSFHNSKIILESIASNYKDVAPVRVWPHHFDTGTYLPLNYNEKGEMIRSIGMGMAIPDEMVSEPYFYLSFWSANSSEKINGSESLLFGEWKTPEWNGAVLPLSDFLQLNAEKQYETVLQFFNTGITSITKQFK